MLYLPVTQSSQSRSQIFEIRFIVYFIIFDGGECPLQNVKTVPVLFYSTNEMEILKIPEKVKVEIRKFSFQCFKLNA